MFAQQIRKAGLALAAAAILATTFATAIPASAAPQQPIPGGGVYKGGTTADLQVRFVTSTTVGNTTKFKFVIQNNGPADAPQFTVYREARAKSMFGSGTETLDSGYLIWGLNSGEAKELIVTCTPKHAGMKCTEATAMAYFQVASPTDPDFNNNVVNVP